MLLTGVVGDRAGDPRLSANQGRAVGNGQIDAGSIRNADVSQFSKNVREVASGDDPVDRGPEALSDTRPLRSPVAGSFPVAGSDSAAALVSALASPATREEDARSASVAPDLPSISLGRAVGMTNEGAVSLDGKAFLGLDPPAGKGPIPGLVPLDAPQDDLVHLVPAIAPLLAGTPSIIGGPAAGPLSHPGNGTIPSSSGPERLPPEPAITPVTPDQDPPPVSPVTDPDAGADPPAPIPLPPALFLHLAGLAFLIAITHLGQGRSPDHESVRTRHSAGGQEFDCSTVAGRGGYPSES